VGAYCGIDIALESVRSDGRLRYNVGQHAFPAALFVGDCFDAPLPLALQPFGPFDVVSCQFALHYSFGSEQRARRALQNVASLLRAGGVFLGTTADADVLVRKLRATHGLRFGNELYAVEFEQRHAAKAFSAAQPFGLEYRFTLADAVDDVAEYLVNRATLERLAAEVGLQLEVWRNFHGFVADRLAVPDDRQLWVSRGLGGVVDDATGAALPARCALSDEEWEVAHLYAVFAFRKARPCTAGAGVACAHARAAGGRGGRGAAAGGRAARAHARRPGALAVEPGPVRRQGRRHSRRSGGPARIVQPALLQLNRQPSSQLPLLLERGSARGGRVRRVGPARGAKEGGDAEAHELAGRRTCACSQALQRPKVGCAAQAHSEAPRICVHVEHFAAECKAPLDEHSQQSSHAVQSAGKAVGRLGGAGARPAEHLFFEAVAQAYEELVAHQARVGLGEQRVVAQRWVAGHRLDRAFRAGRLLEHLQRRSRSHELANGVQLRQRNKVEV